MYAEMADKKLMHKRVRINKYPEDSINAYGRVIGYDPNNGKWWVTNMNMPYMGTISAWFSEDELTVVETK